MASGSPVLVVVHPGSACGSADMTLGREDAARCRDVLEEAIASWRGGVAVIDGFLSDELDLPAYSALGDAVRDALARARSQGHVSLRIYGSDDEDRDQMWAAAELARRDILRPEVHQVEVTGCWHDPQGRSGCVTSVWQVLEQLGFSARVAASAVQEPPDGTGAEPGVPGPAW